MQVEIERNVWIEEEDKSVDILWFFNDEIPEDKTLWLGIHYDELTAEELAQSIIETMEELNELEHAS
jgi:hypothetical protein